jgi:hypothetical protein
MNATMNMKVRLLVILPIDAIMRSRDNICRVSRLRIALVGMLLQNLTQCPSASDPCRRQDSACAASWSRTFPHLEWEILT